MSLTSSYIDEYDPSMEFEIVDERKEECEESIESSFIYSTLELPNPEDSNADILTCGSCYNRMNTIMMLITDNGTCQHNYCESCVETFQQDSLDGKFLCPRCGASVLNVCENEYATTLANALILSSNTKQVQELEMKNKSLQELLSKQQEEYNSMLHQINSETDELRVILDSEKSQNCELHEKMRNLLCTHQKYKAISEARIIDLKERIETSKESMDKQVSELARERESLISMQKHQVESSIESMNALELKIHKMEESLESSRASQKNLERMCIRTVNQLNETEEEADKMRVQLRKEQVERSKASKNVNSLTDFSKSVTGLLWAVEPEKTNLNLVKELSEFQVKEIRGSRKDGRVRKATCGTSIFALKKVTFDPDILLEQSILGTFKNYWYSKSEQQLSDERIKKRSVQIETFREAMLLFKLNCDFIISLQGIVKSPELGELYLQLPFIEHDLDYAMEDRGSKLLEKDICWIIYQLLLAVYYLHSGNIVHRHISPATILTNDLRRIYLGGLSVAISLDSKTQFPSIPSQHLDCIAPELLYMSSEQQSIGSWKPIDMWAVGTILYFLLKRESLFKGASKADVLESILRIEECTPKNCDELVSRFYSLNNAVKNVNKRNSTKKTISQLLPNASSDALDLCSKLLKFNPSNRITAKEALKHPYFVSLPTKNISTSTCAVGYECADCDIPSFVESYCPSIL